jgi:hypothetical protein
MIDTLACDLVGALAECGFVGTDLFVRIFH